MEGITSEEIFDSFNLNPQLFINEILNTVDDIIEGGFDFFEREAPVLLGVKDDKKSKELSQGISSLRHMVQAVLDKRLSVWEKYCLRHCFVVPEGFLLPKHDSSGDSSLLQSELSDVELDTQLDSLREKLVVVGRESAMLSRDLRALEKQSILSRSCTGAVNEVLQLLEHNSMHVMSQEVIATASELRMQMERLMNKRREEMECARLERIYSPNGDHSAMLSKSSSAKLEDLLEFVDHVKSM